VVGVLCWRRRLVVALFAVWAIGLQPRSLAQEPPFVSASPSAAVATSSTPPARSLLAVERFVLDNGLEVIVHADRQAPEVTVNVRYHVGAAHDPRGRSGLANLVEHLMFRGSAHVSPGHHERLLEEAGATDVGGTTDFDFTEFTQTVPRQELPLALWLEADRMGWLMDALTHASLDAQRAVVKNERRQRIEAAPWGVARERLWRAVFPPEHPLAGMVIGTEADLDRITLDDVRAFYDDFYAPSNATLVVTGDVDGAAAKALVQTYFGSLPAWKKPAPPSLPALEFAGERHVEHVERVGTLPRVELMWLVPGRGQPGELELQVLARALGAGLGSTLQEALLVQTEQAESVVVSMDAFAGLGVFSIAVVVRPEATPTAIVETVIAQLNFLQEIPIGPEQVARAKKGLEREALVALDEGATRAAVIQDAHQFDGGPTGSARRLDDIAAVTDASVADALSRLITSGRAVMVALPSRDGATAGAVASP
jgi:zinc protease